MFREQRTKRRVLWTEYMEQRMQPTGEGWTVVGRGDGVGARGCQMEMLSYTSVPLLKSDLVEMYREKKEMQM